MTRQNLFRFLGAALLLAIMGNGCLCLSSHKETTEAAPPEPPATPQDKVEKCVSTCGSDRRSCQIWCKTDDVQCSRSCVSAYDKCLEICGSAKN